MGDQDNPNDDPLNELFADAQELDRQLLADTLLPYVRLTRDGEFIPTSEWNSLNLQGKVLTFMLAQKALRIKGVIDDEKVTASLIEDKTELKGGSIRPTLSKLLDERLVRVDNERNYHIPDFKLVEISQILKGA